MPDAHVAWRIIYRVDPDGIVIGAVFAKKTPQIPDAVVVMCRKRFRAYDESIEE